MNKSTEHGRVLYFGYGSNLDYADWTKWCNKNGFEPSGLKEIGPAWIDGYSLNFDYFSPSRNGGAANLNWIGPGMAATPGALYEIDNDTLRALDQKEGHPSHYERFEQIVYTVDGRSHQAYTYIHSSTENEFHSPTKEYEGLIRNGLQRLGLPRVWLDAALNKSKQIYFDYVFVYGSLMKGMTRHREMENGSNFYCKGSVKGHLYEMGDYPGMIPGDGVILGEVYKADDMFQMIQRLDWIEGTGGENPLFTRSIQEVETDEGAIWAYVYHYGQSLDPFEQIKSGNWKNK